MDIRFIAIIFLIAALMEMISKALKKKRGVGIEDGSGAESVDPLRRALEETPWSMELDEDPLPGRGTTEGGAGERPDRVRIAEPDASYPVARVVEQAPPRRATEVPAPVSPPGPAPMAPYRDRAPRPVEVRSREARPLPSRRRVETPPVRVVAGTVGDEVVSPRQGLGRGGPSGGLDLGSVSGLRRLIVAREVLGPPLALRTNDREPGSAE